MNKLLLVAAVATLAISACWATPLTPRESWYELQSASWFAKEYQLAIASFSFDDELYILDGSVCPLLPAGDLSTQLPWPADACACSFLAGSSDCGSAVAAAPSPFFPAGVPAAAPCADYCRDWADADELCSSGAAPAWQLLDVNATAYTRQDQQRSYFRYVHRDPTAGFRLDVLPLGGTNFYVFGSRTNPAPDRWDNDVQYIFWFGRATVQLCPMFAGEFATGTWFFAVEAVSLAATANGNSSSSSSSSSSNADDLANLATVEVRLVPGRQADSAYPRPDGCDPRGQTVTSADSAVTIECLRDGETVYRTQEQDGGTSYFYLMVEQCALHAVHLHSPDGDRDLYMSFGAAPLGSDLQNWDLLDLATYNYGDEYYAFNPCIDGRQPPFPLFLIVDFLGAFYLTVASRGVVDTSRRVVDWPVAPAVQTGLLQASAWRCDADVVDPDVTTCDIWSTDCRYAWVLYPYEQPAAAYPLPTSLNSGRPSYVVDTLYLGNGSDPRWPHLPQRYAHAVLLSGPQLRSIDVDQLHRCSVVFPNGRVGNAARQPVGGSYPLSQRRTAACDAQRFAGLTSLAAELYGRLAALPADDNRHIVELAFALDTLQSTPLWQQCDGQLDQLIEYDSQPVTVSVSAPCNVSSTANASALFDTDPCCSLQGQSYAVCPDVAAVVALPVARAVDVQRVAANTSCSACAVPTLQQLALVQSSSCALRIDAVDGDTSAQRVAVLNVVDACLLRVMGPRLADGVDCDANDDPRCERVAETAGRSASAWRHYTGDVPCRQDADCGPPSWRAVCDRLRLRCVLPAVLQEQLLLRCIVANLTASARSYTQRLLAVQPPSAAAAAAYAPPPLAADSPLEALLWNRTRMLSCGGDYELPLPLRHHWRYEVIDADCARNFDPCHNRVRTDKERAVVGETCRDYCGNVGALAFYPATPQQCAEQSLACSNAALVNDSAACQQAAGFCAACSDDSSAADCLTADWLGDDEAACRSAAPACLLPDGVTLLPGLSQADCEALGQCDGLCPDYRCLGPPACAALDIDTCALCSPSGFNVTLPCPLPPDAAGLCTVSLLSPCADEASCTAAGGHCTDSATPGLFSPTLPGYCATAYNYDPFGLMPYFKCDDEPYTNYQLFGCSAPIALNPVLCALGLQGDWRWAATTRDQCLAVQSCVADVYSHNERLERRGNYFRRDDCTLPNQRWRAAFDWTPGVWRRGRLVELTWRDSVYASRYRWTSTIDFDQLVADLLQAADLQSSSGLQADSVCRFNRLPLLLDQLTCDCIDDEPAATFGSCRRRQRREQAQVQGSRSNDVIGAVFQCTDDLAASGGVEVYSPPALLQLPVDAIRPSDVCVYFNAHRVAAGQLARRYIPRVPLSFAGRPALQTMEVVVNTNDVVVGAVVGDGVYFDELDAVPVNWTLCLLATLLGNGSATPYTAYDFAAVRSRDGRLLPHGLAGVELVERQPLGAAPQRFVCVTFSAGGNVFNAGQSYVPVRRLPDRRWQQVDSEYTSDELALIYTLAALYSLLLPFGLLVPLAHRGLGRLPAVALCGGLFVVAMRMAYFYTAGAGVYAQGALVNLEFVLIILPIFVLFAVFAMQAVAWTLSLNKRSIDDSLAALAAANAVFFLSFVVWTVLFAALGPDIGTTCGGLVQPSVDSSARDALNLAFTIFLVVLAVLLLVVFVVAPVPLMRQIHKAGETAWARTLLVIFVRVGSPMLGLLILAVLILVLSVDATASEYFVFFMLLVGEILPLSLMFYRLGFVTKDIGSITGSSASASLSRLSGRDQQRTSL